MSIPLSLVGAPIEAAISLLPTTLVRECLTVPVLGWVLVPPVNVTAVAKSAVLAATDPSIPAGPMDIWQIAANA